MDKQVWIFPNEKSLKNAFNLKFVRTSTCFQKAKICSVTSLEQKKRTKTINFMTYKYACCFESVVLSAMKFISAVFQMKTVAYLQLSYQLLKRSLHWRLGIYHLQKKLILFNLRIQNSNWWDHNNALRPRGLTVYSRNHFLNLPPGSH